MARGASAVAGSATLELERDLRVDTIVSDPIVVDGRFQPATAQKNFRTRSWSLTPVALLSRAASGAPTREPGRQPPEG